MTDHKRAMPTAGLSALRHFGRTTNKSGEKIFCHSYCKLLGWLNYHMKAHMYVKTAHITYDSCTWLHMR